MDLDKEQLQDALNYFDTMINDLLANPPEDFNMARFGKHYNTIRNSLAFYMKDD